MALATPASASAALMTSLPREELVCGDAIRISAWENPNKNPTPKSRRKVSITVKDASGNAWWTKTVTATHKQRAWYLPSGRRGECGTTTITITGRPYGKKIMLDGATVGFRSEGV